MLNKFIEMNVAQPSLRAIAEALEVPQTRLYTVSKMPIPGAVYDSKVYNWDAITKFTTKRIGPDCKFKTLEEVILAALAADATFATSDTRRRNVGTGSSKSMIDIGEDKKIPARRYAIAIGDVVEVKGHTGTLTVVYMNEASVVLKPENSLMLSCLSNWTLNQKMKKPVAAPAVVVAEVIA